MWNNPAEDDQNVAKVVNLLLAAGANVHVFRNRAIQLMCAGADPMASNGSCLWRVGAGGGPAAASEVLSSDLHCHKAVPGASCLARPA